MTKNPEFIRNTWLEFTLHRIVATPAVLGAFFVLIYVINDYRIDDTMAHLSLVLVGIFAFIWGTRMAAESVVSEVRDKTWDGQRMSAIGPWEMSWGKLAGSTLYTWYGSLICLSVFAVSSETGFVQRLKVILLFIIGGLFSQSVALLSSLHTIRKDRRYDKSQVSAFMILGLLVIAPFLSVATQDNFQVIWYDMAIQNKDFVLATLTLFLGWTVYGNYRLMRAELQMKNYPWGWLIFVLFISGYSAGFVSGIESNAVLFRLMTAYFVSMTITYLMALSEKKDPVKYRRILISIREKDIKAFLENIDCWMIGYAAVLFFMIAFMTAGYLFPATVNEDYSSLKSISHSNLFVFSTLLFLIRDTFILLFMNLSKNPKRADMAAVVYLGLLYGLFPALLSNLNFKIATIFFWPLADEYAVYSLIAVSLEVMFIGWLLKRRWDAGFNARY